MYNTFFYFENDKPKFGLREIERPPYAYSEEDYKVEKWLYSVGLSSHEKNDVGKEIRLDNDYVFDSLEYTQRVAFKSIFKALKIEV
jgi:hypothetical protein